MTAEGLTEAEREALFGTLAETVGRSYGPDALVRQVERILADRLAAVQAEAEKSREESRHARQAAAEYVTVALETRARAESAEAERDALQERVEALANDYASAVRAHLREGPHDRESRFAAHVIDDLRAALDADR